MTAYTFDPYLITTLSDGQALANSSTTPAEAGWQGSVSVVSPATMTFDGVAGTLVCDGTNIARLNHVLSASSNILAVELDVDLGAVPGATSRIAEVRYAANYSVRLNHLTTGAISVDGSAATNVVSTSGTYTGRVRIALGLNYSTGRVRLAVYSDPLSTTPAETPADVTGLAIGGGAFTEVRTGHLTTNADTIEIVNIQASDVSTDPIGPILHNDPPVPVVNAGGYTVDLTDTVVAGTPTYACTVTGGLTVVERAPGVFAVTQDASPHTLTFTVTDSNGTGSTDVVVPAEGGAVRRVGRLVQIGGVLR